MKTLHWRRTWFAVMGCCGFLAAAQTSPAASELSATSRTLQIAPTSRSAYAKADYVDSIAQAEAVALGIPGLSMAIVKDSKLVHASGFGIANRYHGTSVSADTLFNLASVSKPLTAVAVLQLAEQRKLDINAPVQKYVPSFPLKQWPVTSSMLLGHLAGIRHYKGRESFSAKRYTDVLVPLEIFQNDPLVHKPGTAYLYSSYGFNLLGAAVQGASGEPFVLYMKRHIFDPSQMASIRVYDGTVDVPIQAVGYQKNKEGQIIETASFDATNKIPSGGFLASAPDIGRFMAALFAGKLLKESTRKIMWTPQILANAQESKYGMGWNIAKLRGNLVVSHSGSQPGFSTLVYALPERGFAVILLANLDHANLSRLAAKIRDAVF